MQAKIGRPGAIGAIFLFLSPRGRLNGRRLALPHFPLHSPGTAMPHPAAQPPLGWARPEGRAQPPPNKGRPAPVARPTPARRLAARGNGRDDFPVSVLWGVVLLSILCRHSHV